MGKGEKMTWRRRGCLGSWTLRGQRDLREHSGEVRTMRALGSRKPVKRGASKGGVDNRVPRYTISFKTLLGSALPSGEKKAGRKVLSSFSPTTEPLLTKPSTPTGRLALLPSSTDQSVTLSPPLHLHGPLSFRPGSGYFSVGLKASKSISHLHLPFSSPALPLATTSVTLEQEL